MSCPLATSASRTQYQQLSLFPLLTCLQFPRTKFIEKKMVRAWLKKHKVPSMYERQEWSDERYWFYQLPVNQISWFDMTKKKIDGVYCVFATPYVYRIQKHHLNMVGSMCRLAKNRLECSIQQK